MKMVLLRTLKVPYERCLLSVATDTGHIVISGKRNVHVHDSSGDEQTFIVCNPIYLRDERILIVTGEEEVCLLDSTSLEIIEHVDLGQFTDIWSIRQVDPQTLVTSHYGKGVRLWEWTEID